MMNRQCRTCVGEVRLRASCLATRILSASMHGSNMIPRLLYVYYFDFYDADDSFSYSECFGRQPWNISSTLIAEMICH